jgi:hypothetical protein
LTGAAAGHEPVKSALQTRQSSRGRHQAIEICRPRELAKEHVLDSLESRFEQLHAQQLLGRGHISNMASSTSAVDVMSNSQPRQSATASRSFDVNLDDLGVNLQPRRRPHQTDSAHQIVDHDVLRADG